MEFCTYIVCLGCRQGRQLIDEGRFGQAAVIERGPLAIFVREHVRVGHEVVVLASEAARQVVIPETFVQENLPW